MSEHTPGPWKFLPDFGRVETEARIVAYIAGGMTDSLQNEALRNGALIAAAPETLEALESLHNEIKGWIGNAELRLREELGNTNVSVMLDRIAKAEAAIQKAKGEQP